MTLQEYVDLNGLTLKKLEKKTGINFRILHRYLKGQCLPSLTNAHKIYLTCGRKVKLGDWFPNAK
jgi:transcriptional regulator with XRE-family HTH domain